MLKIEHYVRAETVISPRDKISGKPEIVFDSAMEGDIVVAWLNYEGKRELCMRWNGTNGYPLGFPNARGYATWHVIGERLAPIVEYAAKQLAQKKKPLVPDSLEALMQAIHALGYNVSVSPK